MGTLLRIKFETGGLHGIFRDYFFLQTQKPEGISFQSLTTET